MRLFSVVILSFLAMFLFTSSVHGEASYSPYANQSFPTEVYWCDTHLHTILSKDAQFHGFRNLGPGEAYRFARSETVTMNNGMKAKLKRPLDFLVIADHANGMGLLVRLELSDPLLLNTQAGSSLYKRYLKVKNALP